MVFFLHSKTAFALLFSSQSALAFTSKTAMPPQSQLTNSLSASTSSMEIADLAAVPNPPDTKTAKGVLFDIDGTLADSWRLGYDATVVVLENNAEQLGKVEINEKIYHETCVYATPERLARTAGFMPDHPEFETIGNNLGQQFDEHYVALVSISTAEFYDGMMNLLQNLPGDCKLGALTNACAAYGHAVLTVNCPVKSNNDHNDGSFALYDRFGTIHGADTVPQPKPHPSGLLQCAAEIGLEPQHCIYVGDSPGDGRAARAAGMISVGVTWGSNAEEKMRNAECFDYLCRTMDDLKSLLPQIE